MLPALVWVAREEKHCVGRIAACIAQSRLEGSYGEGISTSGRDAPIYLYAEDIPQSFSLSARFGPLSQSYPITC